MTADFVRKYFIYKIISNPSYYGFTTTDGYVSKSDLIQILNKISNEHAGEPLYEGIGKYSERNLRRDLGDIKTFFNVEIELKKNYGYRIAEKDAYDDTSKLIFDKMELFLASHKEREWSPFVSAEDSSLNTAIDILGLVKAIENEVYVSLSYKGWYDDALFRQSEEKVQPLHIKETNRGWYLIAFEPKKGIQTYCLDERVTDLIITKDKVKSPIPFDVADYYRNSIGILNDDTPPERVVLQVANHHFKYLKSKPMHHSQKIIRYPKKQDTNDLDYLDADIWGEIELFVQPNYEFLIEIHKFSIWVKITEPQWVAQKIANHFRFMLTNYYGGL